MGIDENRLYFDREIDFLNYNSQTKRNQNKIFLNDEINRNKLIKKRRSESNTIFGNKGHLTKKYSNRYNSSDNITSNNNNNDSIQFYNNYIEKNKSMTDYWKLRYDRNKENERFYLIQKQNLAEIKNLIDLTVRLYNKARHNNYDDYIHREEEKNKLKLKYQKKRDKEYNDKEMMDKEIDLIDKKKKEKEFNIIYLNLRKIDEKKEQKIIDE